EAFAFELECRSLKGVGTMRFVWSSFFFSSRRRHTRLVSDWSSDVCSSDLRLAPARHGAIFSKLVHASPARVDVAAYHHLGVEFRSEERRVGKEGRCRGAR